MNRLKLLRGNNSQTYISDKIGISQRTYSNYENGTREPDQDTLGRIADYFNVSVDYLLGRTDAQSELKIPPSIDGVKFAFYGDPELTQGDIDAVESFIALIKLRKNEQKKNI